MALAGIDCHAYGNENACHLCSLVNWGHPVTVASMGGREDETPADRTERLIAEQVEWAMRGGWHPKKGTVLDRVARNWGLYDAQRDRVIAAARAKAAADDTPPPF